MEKEGISEYVGYLVCKYLGILGHVGRTWPPTPGSDSCKRRRLRRGAEAARARQNLKREGSLKLSIQAH